MGPGAGWFRISNMEMLLHGEARGSGKLGGISAHFHVADCQLVCNIWLCCSLHNFLPKSFGGNLKIC